MAIFIAIGFLMWFTHYWDFADLCGADEGGAYCFRAWFGASAGYFAAVAAGITLFALFAQVAEQKRQTDFLLGNSLPAVDAIAHQKNPFRVVLRIVNWNRHPVILSALKLSDPAIKPAIESARIWDRDDPKSKLVSRVIREGHIVPAIAMHGWKDRSAGPCEVRIDISAKRKPDLESVFSWGQTVVEIDFVLAGEHQSQHSIWCHIADSP